MPRPAVISTSCFGDFQVQRKNLRPPTCLVCRITASALPKLGVMSLNEVTRDTDVESVGQVGADILEPVPA